MDHQVVYRSGTDDDNHELQHHGAPERGRFGGSSCSFPSSAGDIELEVHNLELYAYGAVLRAFKAQTDAITWEREGTITKLRKELRVSNDEHRMLLNCVSTDEFISQIKERIEGGSLLNGNQVATTAMGGSTLAIGGRRTRTGQSAFTLPKHVQDHGDPMDVHDLGTCDPLIGRRVMIKWPADNMFHEALITEYNPVNDQHSLVYDSNTPNATLEWVDIKEVPCEDIRWVGDAPLISQPVEAGVKPRRGRGRPPKPRAKEIQPSGKGLRRASDGVENVLARNPDNSEIQSAEELLKEQEHMLVEAIAMLQQSLDDDDEHPLTHGQSSGAQHTDNYLAKQA